MKKEELLKKYDYLDLLELSKDLDSVIAEELEWQKKEMLIKKYSDDEIKILAEQSRNSKKCYIGDTEISFRPNDSTILKGEYADGFKAGFNYWQRTLK